MKKILPFIGIMLFINTNAQFKKLKEKLEKAVTGQSSQPANSNSDTNSSNANNANDYPSDFTYLDEKDAITKYGTKVYTIPNNFILLRDLISKRTTTYITQYWLNGSNIEYYFTVAIPPPTMQGDVPPIDPHVFSSNGKYIAGYALDNKLYFTDKSNLPSCVSGDGSFAAETDYENSYKLSEKAVQKLDAYAKADMSNATKAKISVVTAKAVYGPYESFTVIGVGSRLGNVFYNVPTMTNMSCEFFLNGSSLFKSPANLGNIGGEAICSSNGNLACFPIMNLAAMSSGKTTPDYYLQNGKKIPIGEKITTADLDKVVLMNSGQLLVHDKSNNAPVGPINKYTINGSEEMNLPFSDNDFFSDTDVHHWASFNTYATFFSDKTAIRTNNNAKPGEWIAHPNPVIAPKKININNKSYLVWLQVLGQDVFLCKKEL